jgi:hypothetical protein
MAEMLRVLEYFKGVLIMTTNRVKSIDLAIQSRINLAVMYPELEGDRGKKVWQGYVAQLRDGANSTEAAIQDIRDWIENKDEMGSDGLNGRQIRNIFTLAQTLAQKDDGKIKLEHIKNIWRSTVKFRKQLQEYSVAKQDKYAVSKEEGLMRI